MRRAILLRGMLGYDDEKRLDIDDGLPGALVKIKEYKHGERSMGSIVEGLKKQRGREKICRAQLPPWETMSMHVDRKEFEELLNA